LRLSTHCNRHCAAEAAGLLRIQVLFFSLVLTNVPQSFDPAIGSDLLPGIEAMAKQAA